MPWSSSQSPICSSRSDASSAVSSTDLDFATCSATSSWMLTSTRRASGLNLPSASIASLWRMPATRLAQVRDRPRGGRGRVVQLVGEPGRQLAERQQLLALADDLALPQPADHMAFEQVHGHRELSLHEAGERLGVQHEEP